ncbi:hypothetical protein RF11_16308 [Thelohanellus kitauei]|uniref:Uncharacterized protein n=1 Tax=Thelohanellus kitauei TaxID=669202 RepID=A0A0C2NHZ3_THEKT|nr:hypothetical protein RF11_16308 [Thelohanellus kitauei]
MLKVSKVNPKKFSYLFPWNNTFNIKISVFYDKIHNEDKINVNYVVVDIFRHNTDVHEIGNLPFKNTPYEYADEGSFSKPREDTKGMWFVITVFLILHLVVVCVYKTVKLYFNARRTWLSNPSEGYLNLTNEHERI